MKSRCRRFIESVERRGLCEAREDLNGFTIITNQTKKTDMLLPGMVYPSAEDAKKAAAELIKQELLPKEEWRVVPVEKGQRIM